MKLSAYPYSALKSDNDDAILYVTPPAIRDDVINLSISTTPDSSLRVNTEQAHRTFLLYSDEAQSQMQGEASLDSLYEEEFESDTLSPVKEGLSDGQRMSGNVTGSLDLSKALNNTTTWNSYLRRLFKQRRVTENKQSSYLQALNKTLSDEQSTPDYDYSQLEESLNESLTGEAELWSSPEQRQLYARLRTHHFKLLHDIVQSARGGQGMREESSHVSMLLYVVGVLTTTVIATLTLCLVIAQIRNTVKRKLDTRRRYDKSGEYERVDSVSSLVHSSSTSVSVASQMDALYIDGPIEDVTII